MWWCNQNIRLLIKKNQSLVIIKKKRTFRRTRSGWHESWWGGNDWYWKMSQGKWKKSIKMETLKRRAWEVGRDAVKLYLFWNFISGIHSQSYDIQPCWHFQPRHICFLHTLKRLGILLILPPEKFRDQDTSGLGWQWPSSLCSYSRRIWDIQLQEVIIIIIHIKRTLFKN